MTSDGITSDIRDGVTGQRGDGIGIAEGKTAAFLLETATVPCASVDASVFVYVGETSDPTNSRDRCSEDSITPKRMITTAALQQVPKARQSPAHPLPIPRPLPFIPKHCSNPPLPLTFISPFSRPPERLLWYCSRMLRSL